MEFNRIAKVGIELEGGWTQRPFGRVDAARNIEWHGDGSVRVAAAYVGEAVVQTPLDNWQAVSDWIVTAYPQVVNATCGLHVHVSFKRIADYALLMDDKFYAFFIERLKAWGTRTNIKAHHSFWHRLDGGNPYCRKTFVPDAQVATRIKTSARYAHLNFCLSLHTTIEARVLPMFKHPHVAVSAVQELLSIYEDYLSQNRKLDIEEVVEGLA
jgi:hypothetical protein